MGSPKRRKVEESSISPSFLYSRYRASSQLTFYKSSFKSLSRINSNGKMFKITVGEGSMMSESESEDESGFESSNESKSLGLESCINQEPLKAELQVKTVDVMIADFNNTSISTYSSSPNSKSNPNPHNFASQETDFEFLKAIENHENRTPIIEETEKNQPF